MHNSALNGTAHCTAQASSTDKREAPNTTFNTGGFVAAQGEVVAAVVRRSAVVRGQYHQR
jgi:hypothetical protein